MQASLPYRHNNRRRHLRPYPRCFGEGVGRKPGVSLSVAEENVLDLVVGVGSTHQVVHHRMPAVAEEAIVSIYATTYVVSTLGLAVPASVGLLTAAHSTKSAATIPG